MADEECRTEHQELPIRADQVEADQVTKAVAVVALLVVEEALRHLEHIRIQTLRAVVEHQDRATVAEMVTTVGQVAQAQVVQEPHQAFPDLQPQEAVVVLEEDTIQTIHHLVHQDLVVEVQATMLTQEQPIPVAVVVDSPTVERVDRAVQVSLL